MKRVLLDVDGVIASFVPAYLRLVNAITGRDHSPEQVTSFDIAASLGLTPDESRAAGNLVRHGFCAALDVCDGAREGVKRLREVADVYIVTGPWWSCPTWMHERQQWLWYHFEIGASRVVHTSAKHLVRGDFLVDDRTETLREWSLEDPLGTAIQWITPHNRLDGWTGLATNSWDELIAAVTEPAPTYCIHPAVVDGVCVNCKVRLPRVSVADPQHAPGAPCGLCDSPDEPLLCCPRFSWGDGTHDLNCHAAPAITRAPAVEIGEGE